MLNYTEDQLKESIEQDYGFEASQIKNPKLLGVWNVEFEVKGILYRGSTPFAGALPQLKVVGYNTGFWDHKDPVEEEYYKRFISGKKIVLKHRPKEYGDWIQMETEFFSQEEAERYIAKLDNPERYDYDFTD